MVDHYADGYVLAGYVLPVTTPEPIPIPPVIPTPDLRVLIDFVNDINITNPSPSTAVSPAPIWTDVSDKVRRGGLTLKRGRERPLNRNEAGTATIVFDNFEREFDPESPNSFGVAPLMRRIRAEAGFARTTTAFKMGHSHVGGTDLIGGGASTIWEPIYDGYIESWSFDYPANGLDATATARCMDLLGVMAKDTLTGTTGINFFAPEQALNLALNYRPYTGRAGYDPVSGGPYGTTLPGDRDIRGEDDPVTSAGNEKYIVWLGTFQNQPVRAPLDAIAGADGGNFYINRSGKPAWRDHDWPLHPAGEVRIAMDEERFQSIARVMDETLIYNYVFLTGSGHEPPPFGVDPGPPYAIREDFGSQSRYLRRQYPVAEPGLYWDRHLADLADNIILRYREPQIFISRLDMSDVVTDWQKMLTADLWEIVTVEVTLPNGDVVEQRSMVEGIEIATTSRNQWGLVWWLSLPVFPNLLSADDYSFEGADAFGVATGSTGSWTAETNCTILAQDEQLEKVGHRTSHFDPTQTYTFDSRIVYASRGLWVLQMEASANGAISALAPVVPVDGRAVYVGTAQTRMVNFGLAAGVPSETNPATDTSRQVTAQLIWYASNMTFLSTSVGTAVTVVGTPITGWQEVKVDARAPDAARFAQLRIRSAGSNKAGLFVDEVELKRGG